jgi:hypothetical protein
MKNVEIILPITLTGEGKINVAIKAQISDDLPGEIRVVRIDEPVIRPKGTPLQKAFGWAKKLFRRNCPNMR